MTDLSATHGPCVTIFMDRVAPMVFARPGSTAALIGYVFAHEIGHYLQGIPATLRRAS